MAESSHNLDQVMKELDSDVLSYEKAVIGKIESKGLLVFRTMQDKSPVKTGFYRASHDLEINKISSFRRRSLGKNLSLSQRRARFLGEAVKRRHIARDRFSRITRIADLHSINISNQAPHVHLIEGGSSKQAPAGVFSVGRQKANQQFGAIQSELG